MSGSASLNPDATSGEPPKLKLLAVQPAENKADEAKAKPKPKAAAAFAAADEDEASGKKKRELIPLNYSDDEDDEVKAEKKKRKVKELVSAIPTDKAGLWRYDVKWEQLNEVSRPLHYPQSEAEAGTSQRVIRDKIRPFVAKKSVEYLGSEEEEVIDTVLENMRAHRGPMALTDELEPVCQTSSLREVSSTECAILCCRSWLKKRKNSSSKSTVTSILKLYQPIMASLCSNSSLSRPVRVCLLPLCARNRMAFTLSQIVSASGEDRTLCSRLLAMVSSLIRQTILNPFFLRSTLIT